MEIRTAVPGDAEVLTALHMENLPPSVSDFTQLGGAIVRRFYRNAIARGVGMAYLALEDGVPAGYVLVTANVRDLFNRSLLAGPRDVATFLARANPRGLVGALRTKLSSGTMVIREVPEAVYLVVDPKFRGRRVGPLLMERADAWFRQQALSYYELNAHAGNEAVLKVHFGNGHRIIREYVKDGVRMYTLGKEL